MGSQRGRRSRVPGRVWGVEVPRRPACRLTIHQGRAGCALPPGHSPPPGRDNGGEFAGPPPPETSTTQPACTGAHHLHASQQSLPISPLPKLPVPMCWRGRNRGSSPEWCPLSKGPHDKPTRESLVAYTTTSRSLCYLA